MNLKDNPREKVRLAHLERLRSIARFASPNEDLLLAIKIAESYQAELYTFQDFFDDADRRFKAQLPAEWRWASKLSSP